MQTADIDATRIRRAWEGRVSGWFPGKPLEVLSFGTLCGVSGAAIPDAWTRPWAARVGVSLAGFAELQPENLLACTMTVTYKIENRRAA